MKLELNQKFWEMTDEMLTQHFECFMLWKGDVLQLRHRSTTDAEWEEEKVTQPHFKVVGFTAILNIPNSDGGEEQVDHELLMVYNMDADSGDCCVVELSATALAAILYTGW